MSLTAELLKEFEPQIAGVRLVPSSGGVFEVAVDGELIYSKKATGRHAAAGEVVEALRARFGADGGSALSAGET